MSDARQTAPDTLVAIPAGRVTGLDLKSIAVDTCCPLTIHASVIGADNRLYLTWIEREITC